ncbi:YjbH domain-containing protein [Phaeobacter sp. B1627]|uniref:YjbH domain-containing protein n=1 Tax=Phaeobacter sp. B1627 TaxID=2583809 RepID=UPI001119620B|nr:YjbH domain-containing protein [Phaeobacter sp. B1627]TNJ40981.1 YjbH domain-containing protein [Phaeobacter sp. B1627]
MSLTPAGLGAQTVSNYGTPGLIDIPTAEMLEDGTLAFTAGYFDNTLRATMTFQMLPWVHGSFRYAYIADFDSAGGSTIFGGDRYDRSFDLHFRLREESRRAPAVTLGLRDFGGTGIYASEYLVATKVVRDRFKVTGGVGWGRLAGRGAFSNPLGAFADRFDTRTTEGAPETGQLDFGNWFSGDAALFGGVSWQYNDRLTLLVEYSSDAYTEEQANTSFEVNSPFNFGVQYKFKNGSQLTGSYMYGSTLGLSYTYFLDPHKNVAPGGQGPSPSPLLPVDAVALASWNLPGAGNGAVDGTKRRQAVLGRYLEEEGLRLVYLEERGNSVVVGIENGNYGQAAQAVGRTARLLANTQPPEVERFDIALVANGVPLSVVQVNRADLYELEHDLDGAWRSFTRARVSDSLPLVEGGFVDGAYPNLSYRFGPYLQASFFDPVSPLRYEVGAGLGLDYTIAPGLSLSGAIRQPLIGNLDNATRQSNSVLPRVRSDWTRYASESGLRVEHLTAEYLWRPGADLYARTSFGYLEQMFGGLSAELLWFPVDSRIAFGVEANYVKQRDFDVLFGFQDYSVATGHVSAYYDLPGDYHVQLDVGRYLAGDHGATVSVDREFNNGFKVGAFFTLTDVSFEEFGEGSFDKGIRLEIPVSWLTGRPTRNRLGQVIRPVLRDGGARLNVRNRLYGVTREARSQSLAQGWGRFLR